MKLLVFTYGNELFFFASRADAKEFMLADGWKELYNEGAGSLRRYGQETTIRQKRVKPPLWGLKMSSGIVFYDEYDEIDDYRASAVELCLQEKGDIVLATGEGISARFLIAKAGIIYICI